ncbi:DDE-type integrase/transposase/recombinase [Phytohabitans houttuyneae]|uniref:DDE-type integrase/transposase/recombinase n=1 Tax=Phytohabitans houttuyneae TaxID=1076126 RepID=UPI0015677B5D
MPIAPGTVYAAFIVDVFSRSIVGWRLAGHMRTELPLDALELALWQRVVPDGLVHHFGRGTQGNTCRFATPNASPGPERACPLAAKEIHSTPHSPKL